MQILSEAVGFMKRPDLSKAKPYVVKGGFMSWIKLILALIMGIFFIFVGYMHFARPDFYVVMMPRWMPAHLELVYLSGIV